MIEQYDIVQAFNYLELIAKVNNMLDGGWVPFGNVFTVDGKTFMSYYQPMVYRSIE
jgi:hypothetical protein